ncbi:MAG: hypothetical protein IJ300_06675 [Clostridia bacterium]|nr:hypothetical protein [Clostridia bacterium]
MDYKTKKTENLNNVFDYTFPNPLKNNNVNFYENKHITNAKKFISNGSGNGVYKNNSTNNLVSNKNNSNESVKNKTFKSQYLNDSGKWTKKLLMITLWILMIT